MKALDELTKDFEDLKKTKLYFGSFNTIEDCILLTEAKKLEQDNTFWNRLKLFVSKVEVSDAMSEEEKEYILRMCDKNID
jgi:chaperonin GroEL (HSP60 family)